MLNPVPVHTDSGQIWLTPVSVETYNRPWFAVKNMIDSAVSAGKIQQWSHFNILCHPFRDGSLRHLNNLEKILKYMTGTLGHQATPIKQTVQNLPACEPSCYVYYSFERQKPLAKPESFWDRWWHNRRRYDLRICNLIQSLSNSGEQPALCFGKNVPDKCYAVYPHLPLQSESVERVTIDPLVEKLSNTELRTRNQDATRVVAFVPKNYLGDVKNAAVTMFPKQIKDCTALIPELALRLAYRATPNRRMF